MVCGRHGWAIGTFAVFGELLLSCSSTTVPVDTREGITMTLRLSERFPPQLVTAIHVIIRSVPGGAPVALRSGATSQGTFGGFPYVAQVIDRDSDGRLEFEIVVLGQVFGTARVFEGKLFSEELNTAPFAIEAKLLGATGILATAIATNDVRGRALEYGSGKDLRVELSFDCGLGVPCSGDPNRPPVFAEIPGSIEIGRGRLLELSIIANDPDGDAVTIVPPDFAGIPGEPPVWVASEKLFRWRPGAEAIRAEPYVLQFNARDSRNADATPLALSIRVTDGNSTPVIRALTDEASGAALGGVIQVSEGVRIGILVDAYDPDEEAVTLSMEPGGGFTPSFDPAAKRFTWTPSFNAGRQEPYKVTFVAKDAAGAEGRRAISIVVSDRNREPVFDPLSEQIAVIGQELTFTVRAVDLDGDAFTLSMDDGELPGGSGAQFEPATGRFRWTPRAEHRSNLPYIALFIARDARGAVGRLRVPIRVLAEAPTDGGTDGGTPALLACSFRCGPGEACVGGACVSVTQLCLAPCGVGQGCFNGQCMDLLPTSCAVTCPALMVCVRGGCMSDRDQDGIPDALDLCPDTLGAPQIDTDGDRIGDACDPRPNRPDLVLVGGAPVSAGGREETTGFRLIGTLGTWAMPTVLTGQNQRILPGPAALGGVTNR